MAGTPRKMKRKFGLDKTSVIMCLNSASASVSESLCSPPTHPMSKPRKYTEAEMPSPGSVFLAPLGDGRFGAIVVLARKTECGYCMVYLAPSPWIGATAVRPSKDELLKPLILNHHSWEKVEAGAWTAFPPPDSFISTGAIELPRSVEQRVGSSFSSWESCSIQILIQWRWDNDRERLLLEDAEYAKQEAEERRQQAAKHAEMLKTITLESLKERRWFEHWNEDLDGPYMEPSHSIISSLIRSLSDLPKITPTAARRELKNAVLAFNQLDESTQFIETTHREDICDALELVMFAARQPTLASAIDEWRDW